MGEDRAAFPDDPPPAYSATPQAAVDLRRSAAPLRTDLQRTAAPLRAAAPQPLAAPRPFAAVPPAEQSRWEKKPRAVYLIVIGLAIFAILFGAIFGSRRESQTTQSERDRAYQGYGATPTTYYSYRGPSTTRPYYGWATSTRPYSGWVTSTRRPYNWITSTLQDGVVTSYGLYSSPTQSPFPYPTPGATLQDQGKVPKDLSVAVGPDLALWDLRSGGQLWYMYLDQSWTLTKYRTFLVAPVAVRTGEKTQTAVSIDASDGQMIYNHYSNGVWGPWQDLEFPAQFLRRPAVVSRAEGRVDVINVDNEGHVWIVSYDGESWSEWTELGDNAIGDASATSWGEDRIDVFVKNGETYRHKYWAAGSGWANDWENLGDPFANVWSEPNDYNSSPLAVSWLEGDEGVIDLFMTRGSSEHKMYRNGAWGDWQGLPASHEGLEFQDTQSIVKGSGLDGQPRAHMISRGTDNCVHYISHNGIAWDRWTYLWCNEDETDSNVYYPTQFLPTAVALHDTGNLEVIIRDLKGNVWRQMLDTPVDPNRSWSNDDWNTLGQPTRVAD
ncbi:hypothetical protein OPT61_g7662 [Boeremia exigua]|uniref:Uncharacterized protein n=1 Tax=Boeremia exigua TaxID=749465 RepID=A0ACC2I1B9_9PLEO|nr:hypothetical protein OPT61_g7662 [Boeremia exigua]